MVVYFFNLLHKNIKNGLPATKRVGLARRNILLNPSPHIFWILCDVVRVAFGLFFMLVGSVFRSFFFCQFFDAQNIAVLSVPFVYLHKIVFLMT